MLLTLLNFSLFCIDIPVHFKCLRVMSIIMKSFPSTSLFSSSCRELTAWRLIHEISKATEEITLHIRLRNFTRIMSNINNSLLFRKSGKHIFLPILFSFSHFPKHIQLLAAESIHCVHVVFWMFMVLVFGEKLRFCWVSFIWLCKKRTASRFSCKQRGEAQSKQN